MNDETIRDNKGKFVKGHTPLNPQDKITGRFYSSKCNHVKQNTASQRHKQIQNNVDNLFNRLSREHDTNGIR